MNMRTTFAIASTFALTALLGPAVVNAQSLPPSAASPQTQAGTHINIHALEYSNLPLSGASFTKSNLGKTKVNFSQVNVQGNQIKALNGSATINGRKVPFALSGTLYQGLTSNRVNGVLNDGLGNFKVVRFEIAMHPSKGIYINHHLHGDTLALYLQQKGTRNFVFIEVPTSMILGSNSPLASSVSEAQSFKSAPEKARLWAESLFNSSSTNTQATSHPLPGNPAPPNVANQTIQSTLVTGTNYNYAYKTYTANYYIFGYTVKDQMTVQEITDYPQNVNGRPSTRLEVYSLNYDESNGTDLHNKATGWQVGGGPIGMKLNVGSPEKIDFISTAGTVEQGSSISVSLSYSLSYFGLSATLNYQPGGQVQLSNGNRGIPNAGVASVWIPSGDYMQVPGQYIQALWSTVGPSSGATVTDSATYTYNMYNQNVYNTNTGSDGVNYGRKTQYFSWGNLS